MMKTYDIVGFDLRDRRFLTVLANRTYDVTYDVVYDIVGFLRCRIRYACVTSVSYDVVRIIRCRRRISPETGDICIRCIHTISYAIIAIYILPGAAAGTAGRTDQARAAPTAPAS